MAKQIIDLGVAPNTGTGEPLRIAFTKVNENFTEVYDIAQGAYDYANTLISDIEVDPLARSLANSAFQAANNAGQLAQNAFDAANSSTGDITFDGIKIIGAGEASGDGNGYGTIELVPDNSLYGNDQYIVIDPTDPQHIHIRAGGTQDDSGAELYLGGERNYVRVIDNGSVRLNQSQLNTNFTQFQQNTDYDTATWSDDEGSYWIDIRIDDAFNPTRNPSLIGTPSFNFPQFPQNSIEIFDGENYYDVTSTGQVFTLGNPYDVRIGVKEAPPVNPINIVSMTYRLNTLTQNFLSLDDNELALYVRNDAYINAGQSLNITTGTGIVRITVDDDNDNKSWEFDTDGSLKLPGSGNYSISESEPGLVLSSDFGVAIVTDAAEEGKLFLFDNDGNLTLPEGGDIVDNNQNSLLTNANPSFDSLTVAGNTTVQHIIPSANVAYDLGSETARFRDLYLSGNTIYLGEIVLATNNDVLELPSNTVIGTNAVSTFSGDYNDLINTPNQDLNTNSDVTFANGSFDTLSHSGLVLTSGTEIDQIFVTNQFLQITDDWIDTSIVSTMLPTGTYLVQIKGNDTSVGGQHINEYYSGIMSWYSSMTNSTVFDEIVLHRAGEGPGSGVLYLRVQRELENEGGDLKLQISGSNNNLTEPILYVFKFRRFL